MEKPPEKPPLLYQYRPPKPWAFYNLLRGVVRYSPRWKLNDPCEFLIKPSLCGLTSADYEKLREDCPDLFEDAPECMGAFIAHYNDELEKMHAHACKHWRFVCFSACKHNLLMWSHYAGGGKGFCLEFDTADDQLFHVVAKMTYQKKQTNALDAVEVLKQSRKQGNKKQGVYQGTLAHKPLEWRYEKEWRILERCPLISEEKAYSPKTLKAIYLGIGTEPSTKKQIQDIVTKKYRHAELWEAFLVDDKYKMDFAPANDAARAAHAAR